MATNNNRYRLMTSAVVSRFNRHESLIHSLYNSLIDRRGFHPFLDLLASEVGARSATVVVVRKQPLRLEHVWYSGFTEAFVDWYVNNNMIRHDPVSYHASKSPPGEFQSVVPLFGSDWHLAEGYNRWDLDQNMTDAAWAVLDTDDSYCTFISLQRSAEQGDYQRWELDRLNQLLPYLRQVVQLRARLGPSEQQTQQAILDALPCASLILGEQAQLVCANAAARQLLERERSLRLEDQRLAFRRSDQQRAFLLQTVQAVRSSTGLEPYYSDSLVIHRETQAPLVMVVRPIDSAQQAGGCVLVTIHDPQRRTLPAAEDIASYFGLSAAEAQLSADLASGLSLQEIAQRRHKSEATLRSYLKQIFRKTGFKRQGELVSAILAALLHS